MTISGGSVPTSDNDVCGTIQYAVTTAVDATYFDNDLTNNIITLYTYNLATALITVQYQVNNLYDYALVSLQAYEWVDCTSAVPVLPTDGWDNFTDGILLTFGGTNPSTSY